MRQLELLAPARDLQIGIAAIDCGADAVYIAGPQFGARHAAGNSVSDIQKLCNHAHKFGARIFITLNTILYESELEDVYGFMMDVQQAGADAIIVQDLAVVEMARNGFGGRFEPLMIPLHASTQCAIRTPEQARFLESLGFSRLILERELSLEQIRAIRDAVSCELEFFVHGALCVCYSGQCYLSEMLTGRSANRGECAQSCRSRYDLADASGKIIIKDKALLSLKDYNLKSRLRELADAGITSFKIEGRLKNKSYVSNIVRDYSIALDNIIGFSPGRYERGSFGTTTGGFIPDATKTFNRGYTELYLDGARGKWAAMDSAKSMGEAIGKVVSVSKDRSSMEVSLNKGVTLNNGDGFSFIARSGKVEGFRGDVCRNNLIKSISRPPVSAGALLYRNINVSFEKEIERHPCSREIGVETDVRFEFLHGCWSMKITAISQDGRVADYTCDAGGQKAENIDRMRGMLESQIGRSAGHYRFSIRSIDAPDGFPLIPASELNAARRTLAEKLEDMPVISKELFKSEISTDLPVKFPAGNVTYKNNIANKLAEALYRKAGAESIEKAYELTHPHKAELMRTRYCIKYELGLCPVHQEAEPCGPLFLLNNGKRLALHFDCRACEMTVSEA